MSAFLLGMGFRADMGTCARKLVLLKLIDACEDDGSRIFPAIATIARAAQCSTRQVQRELQAFRDIGLIRLVREGGKGPRSTNEYSLDLDVLQQLSKSGWGSVSVDVSETKGDTVSPLSEAEKGDIGDAVRVTPETDKGDSACHPTPPDPSLDPSIEREARARKSDEEKIAKRWLKRHFAGVWPDYAYQSEATAVRAAIALTDDEKAAAVDRMPDYLAGEKGKGRCAYGVYLAEKRWERLPPKAVAPVLPAYAPAFGPVWGAIVFRDLLTVAPLVSALKGWEERAIEAGTIDRERTVRGNRARTGWPRVNAMYQSATAGRGVQFGEAETALGAMTEFVVLDSQLWRMWQTEFELRGWPWLPAPGRGAYLPVGGPAGLEAFEAAIKRGKQADDGDEREAAE
jgi:hypothetical protein